jgi:hypothetical protein
MKGVLRRRSINASRRFGRGRVEVIEERLKRFGLKAFGIFFGVNVRKPADDRQCISLKSTPWRIGNALAATWADGVVAQGLMARASQSGDLCILKLNRGANCTQREDYPP